MCYRFNKLNYSNGYFDHIADAVFIMTLENKGRFEIKERLTT